MWVAVSCLLGLLIGGVIGGFGFALIQNIRTGRVKIPPETAMGPLKLDLSGFSPVMKEGESEADWSSMVPFIEGSGSAATGCLALIGSGLVLLGFILPWAVIRLSFLASGSASGLSMLIQLVFGVLLALLGTAGGGDLAVLGGAVTFVLIVITFFLIVIPYMGFRIGKTGLRLIQTPASSNLWRKETSRQLIRMAIIGLVPALCYLTTATTGFSGLATLGVTIQNAGVGLWLTFAGFAVAIIAGLIISTTATLAEELARSAKHPQTTKSVSFQQMTSEEKDILKLLAEGLANTEIADRLSVSPVHSSMITSDLLQRFQVESKSDLVRKAREEGFLS